MIKAIPMEDWLRGCVYHDGRSEYVTLPTDKVHQIANYIQRTRRSGTDGLIDLEAVEADRNCSENPNNCEDDEYWKHLFIEVVKGHMSDAEANQAWYEYINHKTEPQTDCPWK